ncbi:flagellar biosynthesis protein FlhB [Anaerovibrio lipolyticus]|uniref:Flagellar biosynthetic protein FlhB n=2 Tax=Anaerovibrio lipolyticus TaxID=82374 RepID=A0A0B2JXU4_9FIRM|nr:flagellar biosynthesis protein FlhB [Anaerovibrio lipolyticus]KHM53125.1 flagellar biosynthesis protein FlhB [Anaerovibrio lipolyticus]
METSPSPYGQYNNKYRQPLFQFDLQLFAGEKTEEPTAKRKADARKKGQVGKSQEINAAFVLLAGFMVLKVLGGNAVAEIMNYSTYIYGNLNVDINEESIMQMFIGMIILLAKTSIPLMVFIMIIGLAMNLAQVGLNFSTETISFDPNKLNPINGAKRMFSKRSLVELIKSLLKIIIIGYFIITYLKDEVFQIPKLIYMDIFAGLNKMSDTIFFLAFKIIGVFIVMAVLDYAYQKWQNLQDLKMSKQEVKEEFKQQEGDPKIKGKIRQKQRQMAMARMMQEVPQADVIVTNPTHFAVALKYQSGMSAPIVIAKGQDLVAQKIKAIARESKVPIVENKPLARALFAAVEIGAAIPQELYKAVAEVLAYVYRLKRKTRYYA